tara:strand:- start:1623 stop:2423 length:801 start_codon:yes stop_codon:yes gene_type:complete
MSKLEIYCVTNKAIKSLEDYNYNLCAVGKGNFSNNYIKCDHGENIFNKEEFYSELTFHYWFWRNQLDLKSENWIGFCQKRRFWIKLDSKKDIINNSNFKDHLLNEPHKDWKNYESLICEEINVNDMNKMKIIKRGIKNIISDPSILFNKNKQTIKLHFDMHHSHGNLDKAIDLFENEEKEKFRKFVNDSTSFNPHIMFIAKPKVVNEWFKNLFNWLFKCEKIFKFEDLKGYDTKRLYAYLAERYLSFWFRNYTNYKVWPWRFIELD